MANAENYQTEEIVVAGVPLIVTSYKIEHDYFCQIANRDPGANIARAVANTRDEARELALEKATKRLT